MKTLIFAAMVAVSLMALAGAQSNSVSPYCPPFYYLNSSTITCQPQNLSPACAPSTNTNNSQVLYLCTGKPVNASACSYGYTFSDNHCILNSTGGGIGSIGVPNISSSTISTFVNSLVSIFTAVINALRVNIPNFFSNFKGV